MYGIQHLALSVGRLWKRIKIIKSGTERQTLDTYSHPARPGMQWAFFSQILFQNCTCIYIISLYPQLMLTHPTFIAFFPCNKSITAHLGWPNCLGCLFMLFYKDWDKVARRKILLSDHYKRWHGLDSCQFCLYAAEWLFGKYCSSSSSN